MEVFLAVNRESVDMDTLVSSLESAACKQIILDAQILPCEIPIRHPERSDC